MNIVFFGTPEYVIPVLENLHKTFKHKNTDSPIVAVVTQKPKPAGRKKLLEYSAVDTWAHKKHIPIYFDPEDIVRNNIKADIGVLASYGKIISKNVINHFPQGILNIHPSLLPSFRGASPVQATIAYGETIAGATIIKLDEELDHGPIVGQFKDEIFPDDTTLTLRNRLFEKSAQILSDLIPAYISGKVKVKAQDHLKATFTRQITKQDAFISPELICDAMTRSDLVVKKKWELPFIKDYFTKPDAYSLDRFIRAMNPWPIAWTYVQLEQTTSSKEQNKKRLKILKAHIKPTANSTSNTNHQLVLDEVQLEGKTAVTWKQFSQGYPNYSFK